MAKKKSKAKRKATRKAWHEVLLDGARTLASLRGVEVTDPVRVVDPNRIPPQCKLKKGGD